MASVLMQCPAAARNHRLFSKRSVSASQHVQQQKNKKNVQNAEAALQQQHQQCTTITTTVTATTTTTTGCGGGGTTSSSVKLTVKDEVKPRASVRTVRNNSLDSYHHHYQYINIPNIITYKRGRSKIPASARLRSSIAQQQQQQQQDTVSSKGGSKDEPDGTVVQLILNKPMTRRMRNSGGGTAPPQLISAGTGAPGAAATDELNGNGGGISRTLPLSGDDHRNNNGDINLELTSLAATAGTTTTTTTTIKRNKRSRSSTKIEKEKNDEKGSKVLRKNGGVVAAATSGIPVATSGKPSGETVVSKGVSSESITSAASTPTASLTRNTFSSSSLNRKAAGLVAKGTGTQEPSSGSNSLKARKK